MRTILLLLLALSVLSFRNSHHTKKIFSANNDTAIINHVLDGEVGEWPREKFEEDKSTSIKYSVDNDAENLYVAMIIPQFPTQMKMMRQGMELYVDIKGKKKESKGIEFPLKSDPSSFSGGGVSNGMNQSNTQQNSENGQRTFDKAAIRSRYALNLFSLRLIGFTDEEEPPKQGLTLEGSVNIGFSWDSSDVMYVEYKVPLSLLDKSSLNQKNISIGWKLNAMEAPQLTGVTTGIVSRQSSGPPRGRDMSRTAGPTGNTNGPSQQDRENFMKEQYIWTKYTINIPSK